MTRCNKVREEFLLIFGEDDEGRELRVAIQQHVTVCPDCAEAAEHTRRIVTLVRERCRCETPQGLRSRILSVLHERTRS